MNRHPKISIVIPVKNGAATIDNCIQSIRRQTIYPDCEIVVIDSGSTDTTLDRLEKYDVKLIQIPPKSFNHGATRNLGVKHSSGDFVVMTVQDAIATDEFWLERMIKHFQDTEVAGVCGQQIVPHDADKNPHEWFRPQSVSKVIEVQFKNREDFDKLSPKEQRKVCGWDDVNAMYRKSVLEQIPFESVAFGEDMLWAKTALSHRYKLVYDQSARVNHYHFQFPEYTYRRVLISSVFIYKCIGYATPQVFTKRNYGLVLYRNFRWRCHPKWILHNFKIIYNHRKATKKFLFAIETNSIKELEKSLALNVPLGKQNTQ